MAIKHVIYFLIFKLLKFATHLPHMRLWIFFHFTENKDQGGFLNVLETNDLQIFLFKVSIFLQVGKRPKNADKRI